MQAISLKKTEVHLWFIDQADFDLAELQGTCLAWLTAPERERYQRYQFDRHRKQLLLGRMLIRTVLSQYDNTIKAADWRFTQNEFGKPALHPDQRQRPLYFNLSHSGGKLVLAVAEFEDIGVDIEHSSKPRRVGKISARYFSARELEQLQQLPEQERLQRFYELWTLKEAYIKACGMGLAIPLWHFSYLFGSDEKLALEFDAAREDDPTLWQLWQLDAGAKYKLALAGKTGKDNPVRDICSWQITGLNQFQPIQSAILRCS